MDEKTLTSNHQADKKALLKKSAANIFGWKCAAVGMEVFQVGQDAYFTAIVNVFAYVSLYAEAEHTQA